VELFFIKIKFITSNILLYPSFFAVINDVGSSEQSSIAGGLSGRTHTTTVVGRDQHHQKRVGAVPVPSAPPLHTSTPATEKDGSRRENGSVLTGIMLTDGGKPPPSHFGEVDEETATGKMGKSGEDDDERMKEAQVCLFEKYDLKFKI
jgi:hypothetical protein